jgi:hypothetical protein
MLKESRILQIVEPLITKSGPQPIITPLLPVKQVKPNTWFGIPIAEIDSPNAGQYINTQSLPDRLVLGISLKNCLQMKIVLRKRE